MRFIEKIQKSGILKDILVIAVLFLITFGLFGQTLMLGFLSDDYDFLEEAAKVHDISSFGQFLKLNIGGKVYRPFLDLSFLSDYWIWKLNPFGYHLQNVVLFFGTCVLIYFLAKFFFKNFWVAFASALFFAVWPAHHESVTWIAGRTDVLAVSLLLLSLFFWQLFFEKQSKIFYVFSLLSFFLAIFSKEIALSFPLLIILVDFFVNKKEQNFFVFIKRQILFYIPYFTIVGFYIYVRNVFVGGESWSVGAWASGHSFFDPLKNFVKMPLYFTKYFINYSYFKAAFPFLNKFIILFQANVHLLVFVFFIFLFLLQGRQMMQARFWQKIIFFLAWVYIAGISVYPLLSALGKDDLCHVRLLYWPSIGFCFALAYFLFNSEYLKRIKQVIFVVLSISFCLIFIINLKPWKIADKYASDVLFQLRQLRNTHSQFSDHDQIYFAKLPDSAFGAYVFRNGFPAAVKFLYQNQKLAVNLLEKKELVLPEDASSTDFYLFEWSGKQKKFIQKEDLIENWKRRKDLKNLYIKEKEKTQWNFFEQNDILGWKINADLYLIENKPSLTFYSRGNDPYLISPEINLPTVIFDQLEIEMKLEGPDASSYVDLYWMTDADSKFDEKHHLRFQVISDGQYYVNKIDLFLKPSWVFSKNLKRIRIDFDNNLDLIQIKKVWLK